MSNLIYTEDGTHTLYSETFKEHYHSIHGALRESMHVFIESGLNFCSLKKVKIFEVGFGTGLNAILTYIESLNRGLTVEYTSIELFPVDIGLTNELNYKEFLSKQQQAVFKEMHASKWNVKTKLGKNFHLTKIKADLTSYSFSDTYDIIYFDAFAPEKQPEMWTKDIFEKISIALNPNAILTTYSSKGLVKNNLREAGLKVTRLSGPKGKRHILRAQKT